MLLQVTLKAHRQQRQAPQRLQPLAAAPQKVPDYVLERAAKPQGVAHLRFHRGSPHKVICCESLCGVYGINRSVYEIW